MTNIYTRIERIIFFVYYIDSKLDHEVVYATKTKCLTYVIKDQNGLKPQPPNNLKLMILNTCYTLLNRDFIFYYTFLF